MTYQVALVTLKADQKARWTDSDTELVMSIEKPGTVIVAECHGGLMDWWETFTSPHDLLTALSQYDALEGWTI